MASSQQPSHRPRSSEPVLITEAQPSLVEEQAARKKRYLITMSIRGVSLVLAAVLAPVSLWFSAVFMVLGTVLPWVAVVMANDRPPKKKLAVNRYTAPPADRVLENPAAKARVIDM